MSIDQAEQELKSAAKAAENGAAAAKDAGADVLEARAKDAVGQVGYALEAVEEARQLEEQAELEAEDEERPED